VPIALMIEAVSSSETSVSMYQTTRRSTPEDNHLLTRRRENLKSHVYVGADIIFFKITLQHGKIESHWGKVVILIYRIITLIQFV
jgi:hypothetical protein